MNLRDLCEESLSKAFIWRIDTFPAYYRRKASRRLRKALRDKYGCIPQVGDVIENCRGEIGPITRVGEDQDTVYMGEFSYSLMACCDWPPYD